MELWGSMSLIILSALLGEEMYAWFGNDLVSLEVSAEFCLKRREKRKR